MKTRVLSIVLVALAMLSACSRRGEPDGAAAPQADQGAAAEVKLAYFPNVTHASALIGLDQGLFQKELGKTKLTPVKFNAGPEETAALLGGSVDIGFIGSGPAINAFAKSGPDTVRVVSGATSGGAQLVVRGDIHSPADLVGKTVADPQQGNTQDVALKKWIAQQKLTGVKIQNLDNALTLDEFKKGTIAGAWVPEPWASRLVLDAGAKVLVDEKTLWPGGKFPTTVVIVRTQFLQQHPATVQAVLRGVLDANDLAASNPAEAKAAVNRQLKQLTGKTLPAATIDRAFTGIQLSTDPLASTYPQLAKDQVTAGIAKSAPALDGFLDVTQLNAVLTKAGKPAVDAAGLDK
ncbi:ABC transporter substrate-binding protein [Labedaea rhizosphaerae]|uniref:NitT/TauT family transport system substrate-binding protein n=1 Tax=Labedaea rhizosphaerae TaxID=598644 RepID=A0A4R6SBL9_LABRH|nr:ABC transporter substrate-binding protein [Labedaea rhizosphaerae]TDP96275.1 NitT/TauT family transport system substrate-binding protein [Labedaea rhizosphaerae]